MTIDTRYPYTYADDYVRGLTEKGPDGFSTKLSRSEASRILEAVADAIGMSHFELASKLADAYLKGE